MATSSSSANRDTPFVAEAHARSIGTAILYIDGDGNWKVGQTSETVSQYRAVRAEGASTVNDDSFEITALNAEAREGGGYLIYAQSNEDPSAYIEITLDATGLISGRKTLSLTELFAAETRYGIDLNDNGGLGDQLVLADDGQADVYIDGAGAYLIKTAAGVTIPLTLNGEPVTIYSLEDYEFSEVYVEADGSLTSYLESQSGGFFKVVSSASGSASAAPIAVTEDEIAAREQSSGTDVNRDSGKPLTPNWTAELKTAALRQELETVANQGGRIDHAGLLRLVDICLQTLQTAGASKVGADIVADLRAVAARGQALFTAKDLAGNETGYLAFVFDQMVNASRANNLFTGGQTKSQALGNLSADSSPSQLGLLRDKWLLGKDLPNPSTQGDTANPNATAATGVYKTFDAPLLAGGASVFDVTQGSAGTCYLMAGLAGVANSSPSALNAVFVSNGAVAGNRTWGVRFFDNQGKEVWVTANDQLVVSGPGSSEASYAKAVGRDASGAVAPEMWVPLIEKAYAQANETRAFGRQNDGNAMFAIEGGMAEPVPNLVGGRMTWISDQAYGDINGNPLLSAITAPEGSSILAEVSRALNAGKIVWIGSDNATQDASGATLFTGGHAFLAFDPDPANPNDTQARIYNPWGFSTAASPANPNPSFVSPFLVDLATVVGVKGYDFYIQAWGSAKNDVIYGLDVAERLDGGEGQDFLSGLGGNDSLQGGAGDDVLSGGSGNDSLDGGDGFDTASFSGRKEEYTITWSSSTGSGTVSSAVDGTDTLTSIEKITFSNSTYSAGSTGNDRLKGSLKDDRIDAGPGLDTFVALASRAGTRVERVDNETIQLNGPSGNDLLQGVERILFTDTALAFDLSGNAGVVARILGAVFGSQSVKNREYVGIGLQLMNSGTDYSALMNLALDVALGSSRSNLSVVNLLYTNLVGSVPSASDSAYFVSLITSGAYSQVGLAQYAADLTINAERINLIGLAQSGIEYTPPPGG